MKLTSVFVLLFILSDGASSQEIITYDSTISDFVITNKIKKKSLIPFDDFSPNASDRLAMSPRSSLSIRPQYTQEDETGNYNYIFNPCKLEEVNNLPAMSWNDAKNNFGFEEGNMSNWAIFMGSNRGWYATHMDEAHFRSCDMYNPDDPSLQEACGNSWSLWQKDNFRDRVAIEKARSYGIDDVGGYRVVEPLPDGYTPNPNNQYSLRLGKVDLYLGQFWDGNDWNPSEMAVRKIKVTRENPYITYKYALSLSDYFGHAAGTDAYFRVRLYDPDDCSEVSCAGLFINAKAQNIPGLETNAYRSTTWGEGQGMGTKGDARYKVWTTNSIDLSSYFPDDHPEIVDKVFIIAFTASNCKGNHDYGYAFVDMVPNSPITKVSGLSCPLSPVTFNGPTGNDFGDVPLWKVYSYASGGYMNLTANATKNTAQFTYKFPTYGDYRVELTLTNTCTKKFTYEMHVVNCAAQSINCADCIQSFAPLPGHDYVLSAWVKQDNIATTGNLYQDPKITITHDNNSGTLQTDIFYSEGPIIDGWQKIETAFHIPSAATQINIKLENTTNVSTGNNVYFDDIRVFPFTGDMKSFVYDPLSQKLVAELDENNYATFYEYDEEGKLRRVKKETERGIMTIKEAGNNSSNR